MFNPIQLKYIKENRHSFKNKEYSIKKSMLILGKFGLASKTKGNLTYKQIDAAKKIIAKKIKGIGIVVVRVYPNRPITKKKKGMRMGKGTGDVDLWVVHIPIGVVLFEVYGAVPLIKIKEIFKEASHKLPLKTKILINNVK